MTEEIAANVLTQDGPEVATEVNAEETATARTPEPRLGEGGDPADPQATATEGDPETPEQKHKRLGGWQRKIQKLEQQNDALIDALKRAPQAEASKASPVPDARPKPPKLSDFPGTVEEFDRAQEEYEKKFEQFLESKRVQDEAQRHGATALANLNERIGELPELPQMRKAVAEAKVPERLTNYIFQEAAKLKNGADVVREAVLDTDNLEQLLEFDRLSDGQGIRGYLHAISHGLRIAGKKSAEPAKEPPQTRAPAPPKPVTKTSSGPVDINDPNISYKDYVKAREAQLKRT